MNSTSSHLICWDMDDTLFYSESYVTVVDHLGSEIKQLNSEQYKFYQLPDTHKFRYDYFNDVDVFRNTAQVIRATKKVFDQHQLLAKQLPGVDVIIITGRHPFSEHDKFLQFMKENTFDIDLVKIYCVGHFPQASTSLRKLAVIKDCMMKKQYDSISMYDDDKRNLSIVGDYYSKARLFYVNKGIIYPFKR